MRCDEKPVKIIFKANGKIYNALYNEKQGYVDIPINEAVSRRVRKEEVEFI